MRGREVGGESERKGGRKEGESGRGREREYTTEHIRQKLQ